MASMELVSESKTNTAVDGGKGAGDERQYQQRRIGLLYDERMCKHFAPDGIYRPENPSRIRAVWNKLHSTRITQRCVVLSAKEAEDKYIASVHTKSHIDLIKNISSNASDSHRDEIAAKFSTVYFNEGSSEAASLAVGSVIEVAEKVAKRELDSAFAIIRPPGHHAEEDEPKGFCLYNNVAVAASFLLDKRLHLGVNKILVVDWDVHHGNGTQKMFWKDPRVLVFSVHRGDFGRFSPNSADCSHIMIGEGPGAGYNINVPWENAQCGDADYLAAWDYVLIPVAKEFSPDVIIISAGFDAALGDPVGGCRVTPFGYSMMLKKLKEFAEGKIVMALEGGYDLKSLASSVLACVEVLLENKPIFGCLEAPPFESTWHVIQAVREELSPFWLTLADKLPKKLTSRKSPPIQISNSDSDAEDDDGPHIGSGDLEVADSDVKDDNDPHIVSEDVGEAVQHVIQPLLFDELPKTHVLYAAYGSNMSKRRFRCYIQGGKVPGMRRACIGSQDKTLPKEILWTAVQHRLFFARDYTESWGPGGVAFLHPQQHSHVKAHICMYKITLEQFNDVLLQENGYRSLRTVFNFTDLGYIKKKKSLVLDLKHGWYHNIVHLKEEKGYPVLTITCTLADIKQYRARQPPTHSPSENYANTMVKALVKGKQLSETDARAYVSEASSKKL